MNPFNVGFGKVPTIFLDRDSLVEKTIAEIKKGTSLYQTTLIYGMRGSGKTTFMTDISSKISSEQGWLTIDLSISEDIIQDFADYLKNSLEVSHKNIFRKIQGGSLGGFGLSASISTKSDVKPPKVEIEEMLAKLTKSGISVLVTIDEINNSTAVKEFASFYQLLVRKNYNIVLLIAGLPENVSSLQNDKVLTFLLRANKIEISPLGNFSIMRSYEKTFSQAGRHIEQEVLTKMVAYTQGYAYAFQLLGYLLWEYTKDNQVVESLDLEAILEDYKALLFQNVYVLLYKGLTEKDKEFVKAIANLDKEPVKVSDIVEIMQKTNSYVGVYRNRMIKSQIVRSEGHGLVGFSLPFIKEFILQQVAFEEAGLF